MKDTTKVQSLREAERQAADEGATAGAKARRREVTESASQTAAILVAEETGRWQGWHHSYRVGDERRTATILQDGRRYLQPAELIRLTNWAADTAAAKLGREHGPSLSYDARRDIAGALVEALLSKTKGASAPLRSDEKQLRSYLLTRAQGLIKNDPDARALLLLDADREDGQDLSPADLAAAEGAPSIERNKSHGPDPMLEVGADGTWPEVAAGSIIGQWPGRAAKVAAWMVGGGIVRGDWSGVWDTRPGYAATKLVPAGAAWLEGRKGKAPTSPHSARGRLIRASVRMASILDLDGLDRWHAHREAIRSGMKDAPRSARAVPEQRPRLEPDQEAPVRIGRRVSKLFRLGAFQPAPHSPPDWQAREGALPRAAERTADVEDREYRAPAIALAVADRKLKGRRVAARGRTPVPPSERSEALTADLARIAKRGAKSRARLNSDRPLTRARRGRTAAPEHGRKAGRAAAIRARRRASARRRADRS